MFTRDLVVFDIESTGLDIAKHEIIQIAAVRLDKATLVERARFSTYIKPQNWDVQDPEAMAVNKISYDMVAVAPDIQKMHQLLESQFPPEEVLLTAYNAWFDMGFLRQSYKNLGKSVPFEFHAFDIWTLAYVYWCQKQRVANPKKPIGFALSDMAALLGVQTGGQYHNALTDVEVEAEVLRRLLTNIHITD